MNIMESPASGSATSSTDSSSVDFTSAGCSPAQALSNSNRNPPPTMATTTTIIDNDDSDSDMSMSTDSDDEEEVEDIEDQKTVVRQVTQDSKNHTPTLATSPISEETTKKRKFSFSEDADNSHNEVSRSEMPKRLKLDTTLQRHWTAEGRLQEDRSLLPAEIWHHIFTFCSPRVLGRLLQVNKSFNAYLDPSSAGSSNESLSVSATQFLTPASIWRASRLLYNLPSMPTPLAGKSELDMWKLACGSACQTCGKKRPVKPTPADQWHPGPGDTGVIPIWSFGIRTCGPCLQKTTMKEFDLMVSSVSVPGPLLDALPFVFLTNELHVLPPSTLQSGQPPPNIQFFRHFSTSQIESIKIKFDEVKALGPATAEEWLKGLDGQGQERRNDAARWERWETQGGVTRMRNLEAIEAASRLLRAASVKSVLTSSTNGNLSMYQPNGSLPRPPLSYNPTYPMQTPVHNLISNAGPPRYASPGPNGFASYNSRQAQPLKHERTKEEVAGMKLARKLEIERRCMLLNPPITAAVLAHMPSFQATLQIPQPVTDSAWEVLKPRLLSQREEAENREREAENQRLAQIRVVQEHERRYLDSQVRSASKDPADREWDEFQAPLRARIGGYADEIIRDGWMGGEKVSHETAPRFAADVLIYVRKRFYAEMAKDEAAIRATGKEPESDPPNGPYSRRLILENMKWVFDAKIKPLTEQYRKELFLCNACEYASKYYGFEGVIQHYAAKHTNALSSGSVVVHWKSEWPEYPPFNPDPSSTAMKPYYPTGATSLPYSSAPPTVQAHYGYGGYQASLAPTPTQTSVLPSYQENTNSYYSNAQYADQYAPPQNGSYTPSPWGQDGYQASQYSAPLPQTTVSGYHDTTQVYAQQGYGDQYGSGAQGMYASTHAPPMYPTTAPEMQAQQPPYVPQTGEYGPSYSQLAVYPQAHSDQAPPKTEEYTARFQDLAKHARKIWNSIGSLKEVPGSLKVHTIIFHVLKKFRSAYQEDPPLSMMVDGLTNNKDMRPVRNVNGLLCKACSLGMLGSAPNPQKKHFSFPQLVNHFYSIHEQEISHGSIGHVPDWTKDMVDLPNISKLTSVVNAPGMDDQKLRLFTEALPEIISAPKINVEEPQNGFNNSHYEDRGPAAYSDLAPSQDNHEKYYSITKPSQPDDAQATSEEYDPRNPGNIPFNQAPVYRAAPSSRRSGDFMKEDEPAQPYRRYEEEPRRDRYQSQSDYPYAERRPASSYGIPIAEYERVVVRDEVPIYVDRHPLYYDAGEVEYRVKRQAPVLRYDEPEVIPSAREYRGANTLSFQSNREDVPRIETGTSRAREDPVNQQNRIVDVVAQISQHAQQTRERQPVREERVEAGSEDGEVRVENGTKPPVPPTDEASNAAERFLNNFRPGESTDAVPKAVQGPESLRHDDARPVWEVDHNASLRAYEQPTDTRRRNREYAEDERYIPSRRIINPAEEEYIVRERAPLPSRTYAYDDRYMGSAPEQIPRDRSPELVDRRYKLNNVVYCDERQGSSNGTRRTPSRYARYESVRLENDRARSRSPVYVKMGSQPEPYRERSLDAPTLRPEPIYHTRTPQVPPGEDIDYDRPPPPRQEYYRVYADEPRPRVPQYAESAYEFVRVADPAGDYMIRMPIRRERAPEPVYYDDEVYSRPPVYESRPQPPRAEPQYEEYDPRQPAPEPAPAPIRQARYK